MLTKLTTGVNFIKVIRARFSNKILAPKITKLLFGFEVLAPKILYEKCAHKMLAKLTTGMRPSVSVAAAAAIVFSKLPKI